MTTRVVVGTNTNTTISVHTSGPSSSPDYHVPESSTIKMYVQSKCCAAYDPDKLRTIIQIDSPVTIRKTGHADILINDNARCSNARCSNARCSNARCSNAYEQNYVSDMPLVTSNINMTSNYRSVVSVEGCVLSYNGTHDGYDWNSEFLNTEPVLHEDNPNDGRDQYDNDPNDGRDQYDNDPNDGRDPYDNNPIDGRDQYSNTPIDGRDQYDNTPIDGRDQCDKNPSNTYAPPAYRNQDQTNVSSCYTMERINLSDVLYGISDDELVPKNNFYSEKVMYSVAKHYTSTHISITYIHWYNPYNPVCITTLLYTTCTDVYIVDYPLYYTKTIY